MPMKIRRRPAMGDEVSTASMSDIAFLLLIFFLVSTIFNVERGLPMSLPGESSEEVRVSQKNILKIEATANNLIILDGAQVNQAAIEPEIRRRIFENPNLIVQVVVHPDAFYGTMVGILDELHLADATKIAIKGMEVVK